MQDHENAPRARLADAVVIAHRNRREVRISAAKGALPEALYNRRPVTSDGRVEMAFTLRPEVAATRKTEISSDGRIGYVCLGQAYEEGGYEPESGTILAKGAGEIMVEQAVALIKEMQWGE